MYFSGPFSKTRLQASAKVYTEQGIALYNPQQHRHLAFLYGAHDPGVCCQNHAARVLWLLGYADQALQTIREALILARDLSQPNSLGTALFYSAWIHQKRGEGQAVQEHTAAAITLGTEQGLPRWVEQGTILRGWSLVEQGNWEEGIVQIRQAVSVRRGSVRMLTHPAALLAEAYLKAGQFEEGLNVVTEALAIAQKTGVRFYEAELHRIKGELLLRQAVSDKGEAQVCFQQAIEVSRNQSAKSLDLRAVMSLSRLWQRQGKTEEARKMLAEIYGWFTEGFDTADLKEAKALLEELS